MQQNLLKYRVLYTRIMRMQREFMDCMVHLVNLLDSFGI